MEGCGDGGEVWENGVRIRWREGGQESVECANFPVSGKTPRPNI